MKEITYAGSLKKQYRSFDAYLEQIGNILFGLCRLAGWWVLVTSAYTVSIAIVAFIAVDLSQYSLAELQEYLRAVVTLSGGIALIACIASNTGRFEDVFSARAKDEVDKFVNIKKELESQIETTESLLITYGLIQETDVMKRRSKGDACVSNKIP